MKKLILSLSILLISFFSYSQEYNLNLNSNPNEIQCRNNSIEGFNAYFNYNAINFTTIETEYGLFTDLYLENTYPNGEIGAPALPASRKLIAIPENANIKIKIKDYTVKEYSLNDYNLSVLFPMQESVAKNSGPEDIIFNYDEKAYQTSKYNEEEIVTVEELGKIRELRVGMISVNPVNYNPSTNTIKVYNNINVEVTFENANYEKTQQLYRSTFSPYFVPVYNQLFNKSVYDDYPDLYKTPVHMLVIAPRNYETTLQDWLLWKTQKGFYVDINYTDDIGTTYNTIRSFVQQKYNEGVSNGTVPTYLVLVGDVGQVPSTSGSSTSHVTDLYYSSPDNDYFPDMYCSRMSAETTDQLNNILEKTLVYEKYTMADPSYLDNVLLIAGADASWNYRVGQPTINYATTNYVNTEHGFNNVNAYLSSPYTGCYNHLSSGVGLANYTAHGSNTSWSDPSFTVSNVNSLTNTDKYFIAIGNCCDAANFGYSQVCLAEAMIRAQQKGAVAYIGSAPSSYWYEDYYWSVGAHTVQFGTSPSVAGSTTGVYDIMFTDDAFNSVNSLLYLGNIAVTYARTGGYTGSVTAQYYWQAYHVFGDGSIMPYITKPDPNIVSHAPEISQGSTTFQVSAIAGSYVAISQNGILFGVGVVDETGSVDVILDNPIIEEDNVMIVVTRQQYEPYIQEIPVSTGTITYYIISATINPSNAGSITGNGGYEEGADVTLTATPNSGYEFANWTENGNIVSTDAIFSFIVENDRNLVANFNILSYTISANVFPSEGGDITGNGIYNYGVTATLTANANTGYTFLNWTQNDEVISTDAIYSFTVSEDRSLTAQFEINTYTVNIIIEPVNGGTVSGDGTYNHNENVILIATPASNHNFENWIINENIVGNDDQYNFNITDNIDIIARFKNIQGIEDISNDVILYPNPANSSITIECNNMTNITLLDLQGKILKHVSIQEDKFLFDISDLESGFYLIKIKTDNDIKTCSFVKVGK
ncbi:MAG: C25 family cysteine peptidase [Bacteroidales bacterium]|jgi:gingipain K|nr:C25 family cysteine peptidase [Bacteroidales bacterium]